MNTAAWVIFTLPHCTRLSLSIPALGGLSPLPHIKICNVVYYYFNRDCDYDMFVEANTQKRACDGTKKYPTFWP